MLLSRGGVNQLDQRIVRTIKAFVAHQYDQDRSAKFKQLDLDKNIMDLFVDLPVSVELDESYDSAKSALLSEASSTIVLNNRQKPGFFNDIVIPGESYEEVPGILELLVTETIGLAADRIVVEGAPGQGKSTITQFLCQVHRMVLLRKPELAKLNDRYRPKETFLPLRFDLRDYAQWLVGRNPFSDNRASNRPANASDVLESFIAAQIHQNTGQEFSATDLVTFAQTARLLVVLDGFDEVADPLLRNKIVKHVSDAYVRLHESALAVQFIVASRPTAFANSPGFPAAEWAHLNILSLTRHEIGQYTQKWLSAMKISGQKQSDIIQVLKSKLAHSHVAYLARNPMQLSILLTLVWKQGSHLPDKRTPLYDKYIDIFLDREAEKNDSVRDNRELLIQIHGYLAWLLQTEAEGDQSAGKISAERLKSKVEEFLREGHFDTEIVDAMFTGVTERVVAIVSRITGTFEFEVQPLQEYFAARFLYDTAPYSPAGDTKQGTLPDRFQAIAKNFYWANVTRFFAGYYSSGELNSLLFEIEELGETEGYRHIVHTTRLRLNLLADHVFAQKPKMIPLLIKPILAETRFDMLLAKLFTGDADFNGSFPWGPSRDEVLEYCRLQLTHSNEFDRLSAVAAFVANILEEQDIWTFWKALTPHVDPRSLHIAQALGVFEKIDKSLITEVIDGDLGSSIAFYLLTGRRYELLDQDPKLWDLLVKNLEQGVTFPTNLPRPTTPISSLGVSVLSLIGLFHLPSRFPPSANRQRLTLAQALPTARVTMGMEAKELSAVDLSFLSSCGSNRAIIFSSLTDLLDNDLATLAQNPALFDGFFAAYAREFPNSMRLQILAVRVVSGFAYGRKGPLDTSSLASSYLAFAIDLAQNSRNKGWLLAKFREVLSQRTVPMTFLIGCFLGLTTRPVIEYRTELAECIELIDPEDWHSFCHQYAESFANGRIWGSANSIVRPRRTDKDLSLGPETSRRVAYLALIANGADPSLSLVKTHFPLPDECDKDELNGILAHLEEGRRDPNFDWSAALPYIVTAYRIGVRISYRRTYRRTAPIPADIAIEVCTGAAQYPLDLLSLCEEALGNAAGACVEKVGEIASREFWFEDASVAIDRVM